MVTIPYFGEGLALATAIVWAVAVILFKKSGETVHPVALNLFKNVFALLLYPLTIAISGQTLFFESPRNDVLLLLISGAIGMGVSDTFFFKSLNMLGASRSAVVDCLYSPFIIISSVLLLGERLTGVQVGGVLLIVGAVFIVGHERGKGSLPTRDLFLGILWGVLAMAIMAVGIVIIKRVLERSPIFWAMEVRLVGSLLALAVILAFHPRRKQVMESLLIRKGWGYMVSGSFVGTYLALILWLGGMKYTQVATASALNQTSNIFVFIFAAIFLKEMITRRKTIAILLGIAGVFLVTFGK